MAGATGSRVALACLIGVGEHQLAPGLAHVPLDVVGEHAQEDVRAHPIGGAVVDRAHLQVDRLERAERALDVGQRLVVAHAVGGVHLRGGDRGADDVDAVQRGLGGDALALAREGEASSPMVSSKCLATLYWLMTLPTRRPIASAPLSLPASHPRLDLGQVALGGGEQLLALVRAQLGQLRIAARHQPLARDSPASASSSRLRSSNRPSCSCPCSTSARIDALLSAVIQSMPSRLAHLVDGLAGDHAAVADHHQLLDAEVLAQPLAPRACKVVAVGDIALVHRHRHRAAARDR